MTSEVSITKVAAKAGVSTDTVVKVLEHSPSVPPDLTRRVLQIVAELDQLQSTITRRARTGRERTIGLVVADTSNLHQAAIVAAVREEAARLGVAVRVANSRRDKGEEQRNVRMFRDQHVQALLILPNDNGSEDIEASIHGPTVFIESAHVPDTCSSVATDNTLGGQIAAEHLLGIGKRRIAFALPAGDSQAAQRFHGVRTAVALYSDATLESLTVEKITVSAGADLGDAIASRPVADRFDAVICSNDLLAAGLLQSKNLRESSNIPDDLAVIGFDDSPFADSTRVPLTSIRLPATKIGKAAVELLLDPSDSPKHLRFEPSLVQRSSTRTATA